MEDYSKYQQQGSSNTYILKQTLEVLGLIEKDYDNMADRAVQYRRTHNLLLMQRLLSFRENTSPFVLVLDSIEQSGKPLLIEYIERAKVINSAFSQIIKTRRIDSSHSHRDLRSYSCPMILWCP